MRSAGPDMIDPPGVSSIGQGEQGPGHVAGVDEVTTGVEVADTSSRSGPKPVGQFLGEIGREPETPADPDRSG